MFSIGINSVTASEEDEKMIKELQRNAAYRNPTMAAATLVGAQAQAMQDAAKNTGGAGAFMGFAGMNMANAAGGNERARSVCDGRSAAGVRTGGSLDGFRFVEVRGAERSIRASSAPGAGNRSRHRREHGNANAGAENTGRFCSECGKPRPDAKAGWTCSCGAVNKGKFCSECGKPKPKGAPLYRCDKCGWEPKDPAHPPKFCPECGDVFDDDDVKD